MPPPSPGKITDSRFRLAYWRAIASGFRDMKISNSYGGHSALVHMRLLLEGRRFRIAQMGPDFLLVESPSDHPPTRATIEMQVDGFHRTWEVDLPQGIKAGESRVCLAFAG